MVLGSKANPEQRTNELAKLLRISERTIEKWIKKLKQQEKIAFKGSKKLVVTLLNQNNNKKT
jgi:Mn-dependent DtxR family transcriptional regulator